MTSLTSHHIAYLQRSLATLTKGLQLADADADADADAATVASAQETFATQEASVTNINPDNVADTVIADTAMTADTDSVVSFSPPATGRSQTPAAHYFSSLPWHQGGDLSAANIPATPVPSDVDEAANSPVAMDSARSNQPVAQSAKQFFATLSWQSMADYPQPQTTARPEALHIDPAPHADSTHAATPSVTDNILVAGAMQAIKASQNAIQPSTQSHLSSAVFFSKLPWLKNHNQLAS